MDAGGSEPYDICTVGPNVSNRVMILWHGTKSGISRLVRYTFANTRTMDESACRLPHEIVEMIIAHLIDDLNTLKSCSLTCRSWYPVVVPHIYHTLLLGDNHHGFLGHKEPSRFRDHLSELHGRDLMPVVKEIWVRQGHPSWFVPQAFGSRDLRYFSAFTNVQTLSIQHLDIYSFIPGIEHYFGQFSQTLRSISLTQPNCLDIQELPYFLTFFPNLDDIYISKPYPQVSPPSAVLAPFSAPKLRGRLVLDTIWSVDIWAYMILACHGLRFRHMELHWVGNAAQVLLEACAKTLETLRFFLVGG